MHKRNQINISLKVTESDVLYHDAILAYVFVYNKLYEAGKNRLQEIIFKTLNSSIIKLFF